ncbi:Dityrosine transporter 1 [Dimargaris cristalligena]|nr:Dityrosine transporter 1 [Dimargaris cristalligena]
MAVHHHLYHSSPQLPSAYTNQWSELSLESPTEAINRRVLPPYTPADRGITDSTLTLSTLGASSATPVGTGTICDLYAKDQRGVALGLFLLGSLLGPMIGPLVGGLTADTIGWRWSFWILAIYGGFLWLLIAFTVPETHRTLVAEASGAHMTQLRPLPYTLANTSLFSPARWRFNPLRPLFFLKYPFVVTTVFNISIIYSSLFCVSASMPHNFAALYDMAPSTIGLTFISVGVGSIFGSLIGGRLADLLMHRAHARYFATTTGNFALKEDGKGAAGSPHSAQFDSLPTRHSTDPHGDNMSDIQSPTLTEPHKFHIHSHSHNHRHGHGHGHGHSHSHSHSSHAQPEKKDLEEEEENASTISTLPDLLLNPQFRLRSGLFFSWLMPTTILLYGLFLHFGFPLASLMVVEFFFGYSMTHMYASYCNFLTDVFLTDSATVTSLYNCMRSLVSTLAVVLEEIVEETWGVHGAFALLAGVHVIGAALMFFTYYRTPKWMERWGIS